MVDNNRLIKLIIKEIKEIKEILKNYGGKK